MKLSVLGLGYVGAVSAGCLAQEGHEVVGVDPESSKVDLINAGRTPIIEKDIGQILKRQVATGPLSATAAVPSAGRQSDLSLICVGRRSLANGDRELGHAKRAGDQIGRC